MRLIARTFTLIQSPGLTFPNCNSYSVFLADVKNVVPFLLRGVLCHTAYIPIEVDAGAVQETINTSTTFVRETDTSVGGPGTRIKMKVLGLRALGTQ